MESINNFMAISKNKQQLKDLRDYINSLYIRKYSTSDIDRILTGEKMELRAYNDFFLLTGCHMQGFGWDLGYWLNRDHKNDLMNDVIYLEDDPADIYVYIYVEDKNSEDYKLSSPEILFDYTDLSDSNIYKYAFYEELTEIVQLFFKEKDKYREIPEITG